MKVNITYTEPEREKALEIVQQMRKILPGVRVKTSDRSAPYLHVYLVDGKRKST